MRIVLTVEDGGKTYGEGDDGQIYRRTSTGKWSPYDNGRNYRRIHYIRFLLTKKREGLDEMRQASFQDKPLG